VWGRGEVDTLFLGPPAQSRGMKIRLSRNNDHDWYHTASNVARKAIAFPLLSSRADLPIQESEKYGKK